MQSSSASHPRKRAPEGFYAIERGGYLTASLEEARRVCANQGGFLFRMDHLYLVGEYEEALDWGWSPFRRDDRPTPRA